MAKTFQLSTSYSTVPQMLDEADFLIAPRDAHARQRDHHKNTLAASAAVVLAVRLDEGTLGVLDHATQWARANGEAADFEALLSDSLRRRVVRLPELLTNSKFQLDSRNAQVRAIHDLIT